MFESRQLSLLTTVIGKVVVVWTGLLAVQLSREGSWEAVVQADEPVWSRWAARREVWGQRPSSPSVRVGLRPAQRSPAAMLVAPARRSTLIARLRSVAITRGAWPVRTWERSSSKVTSRTQCSRFSISHWRGPVPAAGRDRPVRE
jgi:hypothetical protein